MTRLRFHTDTVFKRYGDRKAAATAAERASLLSTAGVRTPRPRVSRLGRVAAFPRIDGLGGMDAMAEFGPMILTAMLKPVVVLHATEPIDGTPGHNPLAKIVSRLDTDLETAYHRVIADALDDIDKGLSKPACVHGDLHAGQIIVDGRGQAWLLDLDDLASGHAEADLGNFAAHLATRPETARERPLAGLRYWLSQTMHAYAEAGGAASSFVADAYGRIALVRRALKMRDKGNQDTDRSLRHDFGIG